MRQTAQERCPEWLSFACADANAQNLANAVSIDADGNYYSDGNNAAGLPNLYVRCIDPQVRPVALDGPIQKSADAFLDLAAQSRYLALGNARHAHRLDELVHTPRRNALDVGLLHDRNESLLGGAARLEKSGEIFLCAI